jgi:pilus assembly protein CpaE
MAQQGQPAGTTKIRILIVDDIPETRENLRKLLFFESDIEVVGAATNGEEGIALAGELKPDIVLMDINLPGIDGITATQTIMQQVIGVQVIMMSVQGETDYLRRSMQAGAREFLIKPFTSDDLISSIRRVYGLGASRREAMPAITTGLDPAVIQGPMTPGQGKTLTVFSPKGGTGCSVVAVNLAIALRLANQDRRVVLVDGCLQFGDVAVLLNLQSSHSLVDLVPHVDDLDQELLENVMVTHHSGVKALLSPPRPELADRVAPSVVEKALSILRETYDYIVVDTSSTVTDITLAALDVADRIVLITAPHIPAIKDAKLFFEVTEALEYPASKTLLILNMADSHSNIRAEDIRASIKHPVAAQLPLDERTIMMSINQGIPYMMSARSTKLSQATMGLAHQIAATLGEKEETNDISDKIKTPTGRLFR